MNSITKEKQKDQLTEMQRIAAKLVRWCGCLTLLAFITEIKKGRVCEVIKGNDGSIYEEAVLRALHEELKDKALDERKQYIMSLYVKQWNKKYFLLNGKYPTNTECNA